jgi:hypothetical protein
MDGQNPGHLLQEPNDIVPLQGQGLIIKSWSEKPKNYCQLVQSFLTIGRSLPTPTLNTLLPLSSVPTNIGYPLFSTARIVKLFNTDNHGIQATKVLIGGHQGVVYSSSAYKENIHMAHLPQTRLLPIALRR